jgi:hypothetical protein
MQARIWAMMQLCLHDPLAARRLRPFSGDTHEDYLEREGDIAVVPIDQGDLELLMDERQPLGNKLADSAEGEFEDIFNENMNNEEIGGFEDLMSESPGTKDDGVFDDLFDDNADETRDNSFEALSENIPNDINDDEFDAFGIEAFEGPNSLNGGNSVAFENTNYFHPSAQQASPTDKRELHHAVNAGTHVDYESMLV